MPQESPFNLAAGLRRAHPRKIVVTRRLHSLRVPRPGSRQLSGQSLNQVTMHGTPINRRASLLRSWIKLRSVSTNGVPSSHLEGCEIATIQPCRPLNLPFSITAGSAQKVTDL